MAETSPKASPKKAATKAVAAKPAAEKPAPVAKPKAAVKPAAATVAAAPAAVKPAATKKAPAAKPATKSVVKGIVLSDEQRYRMVAEAAYYRAEKNLFKSDPLRDWIDAENDINTLLNSK